MFQTASRQTLFKPARALGVAVTVLALAGCGTDTKTPASSQVRSSSTAPTSSRTTTPPAPTQPMVASDRLTSILLTAAEANTVMGATGMQDVGGFSGPDTNIFTVSYAECLGAAHIAQPEVYANSGYTAIQLDVLHEPGNRYTHSIEQAAVTFPSADQALAFLKASADKWKACAGQSVTDILKGTASEWTFGPLVGEVPKISMQYSRQRARGWKCQRALSAVWNLVIDVKACGYTIDNQGLQATDKIAAKATA